MRNGETPAAWGRQSSLAAWASNMLGTEGLAFVALRHLKMDNRTSRQPFKMFSDNRISVASDNRSVLTLTQSRAAAQVLSVSVGLSTIGEFSCASQTMH